MTGANYKLVKGANTGTVKMPNAHTTQPPKQMTMAQCVKCNHG